MKPFRLSESKAFQEELFMYLLKPEHFKEFGLFIPPESFVIEYLGLAWEEVREFYRQYGKVPEHGSIISRVVDQIQSKDKRKAVEDALTVVMAKQPNDIEFIRQHLVGFVKRTKLALLGESIIAASEQGENIDVLGLRNELDSISSFGFPNVENSTYFGTSKERLLKYIRGEEAELLNVGLGNRIRVARGELAAILAPPKRGKSFSLVNIGYGAMTNGLKVLHITLELRQEATELRYDRAVTNLTKRALRQADNYDRAQELINRLKKLRGELVVKYFPANKASSETIYGLLNYYATQGIKFDVLVVDYADLLEPTRKYSERRFELSRTYTDLRALGSEFNMAVWTASQSNKATLNAEIINMSDVAEDIGKMAIVDLAVAFCQTKEERYGQPERARLYIAGAREENDGRIIQAMVDRDVARIYVDENEDSAF
jgi:replicative DNA helicase